MSEKIETIKVDLFPPHLKTEEGAKRFNAAVEQRDKADYECFMALRDLNDAGTLDVESIALAMTGTKLKRLDDDDREEVEYLAERVSEALQKRRDADAAFSDALLGRK